MTSRSIRLSLSGVISVSASECARRVRWVSKAGRVDDQEVGNAFDLHHCLTEEIELEVLVFLDRVRARERQMIVRRMRQLQVARLRPAPAVLHVVGEGLLAGIDVDRGDLEALIQQINGEMESGRGLARAALLIADNYDMRARNAPRPPCPPRKTWAKV